MFSQSCTITDAPCWATTFFIKFFFVLFFDLVCFLPTGCCSHLYKVQELQVMHGVSRWNIVTHQKTSEIGYGRGQKPSRIKGQPRNPPLSINFTTSIDLKKKKNKKGEEEGNARGTETVWTYLPGLQRRRKYEHIWAGSGTPELTLAWGCSCWMGERRVGGKEKQRERDREGDGWNRISVFAEKKETEEEKGKEFPVKDSDSQFNMLLFWKLFKYCFFIPSLSCALLSVLLTFALWAFNCRWKRVVTAVTAATKLHLIFIVNCCHCGVFFKWFKTLKNVF